MTLEKATRNGVPRYRPDARKDGKTSAKLQLLIVAVIESYQVTCTNLIPSQMIGRMYCGTPTFKVASI